MVEAAILATRVHLLSAQQLRNELMRLSTMVEKTAGDQERRAFELLRAHIETKLDQD